LRLTNENSGLPMGRENSDFLVGSQLTLADLAVTTALGIWRGALGKTLPDTLVAYRERLAARPAYQRAMKANQAESGPPTTS